MSIGLAFGESHTERRVRNLMRKRKGGVLVTSLVAVLTIFCMTAFMTIPGINAEGADMGEDMIEGQSFDVELSPYGQVTFAAYSPNTPLNPSGDVAFNLLQDGQVIYTFNRYKEQPDEKIFHDVAAVAFPDLNDDGYTDVVAIINYQQENNSFSEARIYTCRENRYFLEEAYNESHDQKTTAEIAKFAARPENRDYFVRHSIYGSRRVTEHIPPHCLDNSFIRLMRIMP